MAQNHLTEAENEYALALRLQPGNVHARAGLARVLFLKAKVEFVNGKLDDAQKAVAAALKYQPNDPATQALGSQIEQAAIRREIVVANYPVYVAAAYSFNDSLKTVETTKKDLQKQLLAFRSDYDSAHLRRAIIESYDLEQEMHRITLHLINYRKLVESGVSKASAPTRAETPNLLPVP
jgi:tetratricopeptide (TPR) repeat protein